MDWKLWGKAAAIRAIATFAEAMISMLTIGQAFVDVDWLHILSVSGVAALLAVLRCLTGLPEVEQKGVATIGAERTDADRRDDSEEKKDA